MSTFDQELHARLFPEGSDKVSHNVTEADVEYFRIKLSRSTDDKEAAKLQKIIDLLEDAVVIYHEQRLKESR